MLEGDLARSERLVVVVAGSREGWEAQLTQKLALQQQLFSGMLIEAPLLSYLGPVTAEERKGLVSKYLRPLMVLHGLAQPPTTQELAQVPEAAALQWALQGLPTDQAMMQAAFIALNSLRWPLIVDPQGIARNWLLATEADNEPRVVDAAAANLRQLLLQALSEGRTLIVENFKGDSAEPLTEMIRSRQYHCPSTVNAVRQGFKLFVLCLKSPAGERVRLSKVFSLVDFSGSVTALGGTPFGVRRGAAR